MYVLSRSFKHGMVPLKKDVWPRIPEVRMSWTQLPVVQLQLRTPSGGH